MRKSWMYISHYTIPNRTRKRNTARIAPVDVVSIHGKNRFAPLARKQVTFNDNITYIKNERKPMPELSNKNSSSVRKLTDQSVQTEASVKTPTTKSAQTQTDQTKNRNDKTSPTVDVNKTFLQEMPQLSYDQTRFFVHLSIKEVQLKVPFHVDTGADVTLLPQSFVNEYLSQRAHQIEPTDLRAQTVSKSSLPLTGSLKLTFCFDSNGNELLLKHSCFISPNIHFPILGQDILVQANALLDYKQKHAKLFNNSFTLLPQSTRKGISTIYLIEQCILPPQSAMLLQCQSRKLSSITQAIVQPRVMPKKDIVVTPCLISAGPADKIPVLVANQTDIPIHLPKGCHLADLQCLDVTKLCFVEKPLFSEIEVKSTTCTMQNSRPNKEESSPTTDQMKTLLNKLKLKKDKFSDHQWQTIVTLLQKYYHCFSHNGEIGLIPMKPIRIDLNSETPIKIPPYKYSEQDQEIIDEILNDLLQKDVIEKGSGEYGSPIVLVKAPNKAPRLAFDLRLVNRVAIFQTPTAIPNIADLLIKLRHAEIYSTFDIKKAYHHVPLDERSSEILSVTTATETYRMKRLPFGLHSAPHIFSRILKDILSPVPSAKIITYLDDICLLDTNIDDLIKTTETFLDCIYKNNIRLSPEKCNLFATEITLLGHDISPNGVKLSIDVTKRVREYPTPKNTKQLQSFIGLINWTSKWIPKYGQIMRPLFKAVKSKPFLWTDQCENTFQHLKKTICSSPILMHYDETLPLFLITDASPFAYGCILAHKINNKFHPVMFHGKCFTPSECNYSMFEKELKSLYNSVRALSAFLRGKQFTVMVDNKGVSFLKTLSLKDHLSHRWAKWIHYLCEFQFHIEAIRSNANPADPLSRMPCDNECCELCKSPQPFLHVPFKFKGLERITPIPTESIATQTPKLKNEHNDRLIQRTAALTQLSSKQRPQISAVTYDRLQSNFNFTNAEDVNKLQNDDSDLRMIKQRLSENKLPPNKTEIQKMSLESRKLIVLWNDLSIKDNVLYLKTSTKQKTVSLPVIPKAQFTALCDYVHEKLIHPGYEKLINYLRQNYIVFGIATIAKHCTRSCDQCQKTKSYTYSTKPPLTSNQASFQGACVSVDHFGPLPISKGYSYILAITDIFSKYLILVPQKSTDAHETSIAILQNYVKFFGVPVRIHSDNGKCFVSNIWKNLWNQLQVSMSRSTPYHPLGNSLVENFNKSIKDALIICTNSYPNSWLHYIQPIMMSHNATISSATGYTPNFLQLGREVPLPTNFLVQDAINEIDDVDSFITNYATRLHMAMTNARKKHGQLSISN